MEVIHKNKGITLIALVITIIVLIILASVSMILLLGQNGIIARARQSKEDSEESIAKEKLEFVLLDIRAYKLSGYEYNESEYVDSKIQENGMDIEENIVNVDGWEFEIDRSVPEIIQSLGKETEFKSLTRGKLSFSYDVETSYTKAVVSINIDDSISEYTVQYNIVDSSNESENWIDYIPETTFEVTENKTIFARVINKSTNEIGSRFMLKIDNIYEILSQEAIISFDKEQADVNTSIQAKVTQSDLENGINITSCKYIINNSKDKIGENSTDWNSATEFVENPQILNITESTPGTFYLHVLTVDNAENKIESISSAIKFKGIVTYLNGSLGNYYTSDGWSSTSNNATQLRTTPKKGEVYGVSKSKYNFDEINELTFEYIKNANSGMKADLIIGLVEDQLNYEFVASITDSIDSNNLGSVTKVIDVSEITGDYYIKILLTNVTGSSSSSSVWLSNGIKITGK